MDIPTRTRLTTPPGREPTTDPLAERAGELWSPGFAIPEEPSVPGRYRKLWIVLTTIAVLALAGLITFRILTAGQFQDPALFDPSNPPTIPAEGDDQDPTLPQPPEG